MNENGQKSPSEIEADRNRLRGCWELASVLNFLKVFAPIIGTELKMSAEEIETSLILPDRCLRLIHVAFLKGIPPVSKNLKDPDAWVVTLSKKLFMWWPWVAKGDFPLTAAKGAEMETYKNLDPTVRLVILKALLCSYCWAHGYNKDTINRHFDAFEFSFEHDTRDGQYDVIAYINDAVKSKKDISDFRKKNIGEDGKGTSYWLDGNETIGLRLYKEVNTSEKNGTLTTMSCQWETLATNLEEFQNVVAKYSSSKSKLEVAVSAAVETEAIPVLNKISKKKQRELEKKMKEARIMNNFSRSGITRSCRSRHAISYTFDEYDKVISEAIRESKRLKTKDERKGEKKETLAKEDPQQADEDESTESDEKDVYRGEESDGNAVSEESGEESDENDAIKDSGEESDENDASKDSGEESDDNDVSEDSSAESDENVVSEDSGGESDENDEDNKENMNHNSSKDGKIRSRDQQRVVKKETTENEEDRETTESDSDSESCELETKDISENDDDNKENKNNSSKDNADHSIQKMENFGTKKRLVQRPTRNTAIESAIVPDSEDDTSSENSDD